MTTRPDLKEEMLRAECLFLGFTSAEIDSMSLDDLKRIGLLVDLHYKRLRGF